jgi:ubiquinone/menaquinone biosynthesis C-methylase UbiE
MKTAVKDQYSKDLSKVYAEQYDESELVKRCTYPNIQDAWQLCQSPTMKLIDLGCGNGTMTRELQHHTGGIVVGQDLSPAMIETAKEHEAKEPHGIKYFVSDMAQSPIKDPGLAALAPFDFAYSGWTYSYAMNTATLEAMARSTSELLKPGGVLVGLMLNPFFKPSKYYLLERYRIIQSAEGPGDEITDGRVYNVKIVNNPKLPPFVVTGYLYSASTVEKVFRAAGFSEFGWRSTPLRIEAENEYEAQYYQVYAHNPEFAIFRARKSLSP